MAHRPVHVAPDNTHAILAQMNERILSLEARPFVLSVSLLDLGSSEDWDTCKRKLFSVPPGGDLSDLMTLIQRSLERKVGAILVESFRATNVETGRTVELLDRRGDIPIESLAWSKLMYAYEVERLRGA